MLIYAIIVVCAVGLAAYALAVAKGRSEVIENLKEQVKVLRAELKDWQGKALIRHGSTPIGQHRKPEMISYPRSGPVSLTTLKSRAAAPKYNRVKERAAKVVDSKGG